MKRQGTRFIGRLFAAMLLTAAITFQSFAANARIAFSDPSAQVGQEVSVTMKFSSTDGELLGDTKVTLNYDTSMLEYVSGSDNVSGDLGILQVRGSSGKAEVVTELRFRALRAGTASITVSDWEGYDNNGQVLAEVKTGSSSVTIQGLETSSEDATLQSLQISPGTLEPAFTPTVENYTAVVGLDTENLAISAVPNNEHATVALEGDSGLQEGENTVICRVTAEDGTSTKNYTIVVSKVEGGENGGAASIPQEAPEVLAELNSLAKRVQIINLPADVAAPEGLKESEIKISEARVTGWVPEENSEDPVYCVFYCLNENGEADFYRFDRKDKTLQRYFSDGQKIDPELLSAAEKYNNLVEDYNTLKWMFLGVAGALLVLVVVLLILLFVSKRSQGRRESSSRRQGAGEARSSSGRRMSREEQYMMGEEDEYEEEEEDDEEDEYEEDIPVEAYQPEPAKPENRKPRQTDGYSAAGTAGESRRSQPVQGTGRQTAKTSGENTPKQMPRTKAQPPIVDVERALARETAREAASLENPEDTEDFEFFDLDE